MTNDEETTWIKTAAAEEARSIADLRSRTLDEHSHAFRWLIASLLAINGGAAIASLNSEYILAVHKVISGMFFACGIISALLMAVMAQRVGQKLVRPLSEFQGYWLTVVVDGERDEQLETQLNAEIENSSHLGWTGPALGWLSALLFLGGLIAMGNGLLKKEKSSVLVPNRAQKVEPSTIKSCCL